LDWSKSSKLVNKTSILEHKSSKFGGKFGPSPMPENKLLTNIGESWFQTPNLNTKSSRNEAKMYRFGHLGQNHGHCCPDGNWSSVGTGPCTWRGKTLAFKSPPSKNSAFDCQPLQSMLLRISNPVRPSIHLTFPQLCIYQQSRSYKNQVYRKPQVFKQTIVLTDGSTFELMSTTPRKTIRLTRDKFNHSLWNGRRRSVEEESNQQLAKFRRSFAGALGGKDAMKQMVEERKQKRVDKKLTGDDEVDAVDVLFDLLDAKDAYEPTRGREKGVASKTKRKGVRT